MATFSGIVVLRRLHEENVGKSYGTMVVKGSNWVLTRQLIDVAGSRNRVFYITNDELAVYDFFINAPA